MYPHDDKRMHNTHMHTHTRCACVHSQTHTHTHTHAHTDARTGRDMHINTRTHDVSRMQQTLTCMYPHDDKRMHDTHMHTHTRCACVHAHMHSQTYVHTNTHTKNRNVRTQRHKGIHTAGRWNTHTCVCVHIVRFVLLAVPAVTPTDGRVCVRARRWTCARTQHTHTLGGATGYI